MALLNISLLKKQLRLDAGMTDEDELLAIYLGAAEVAASNYMGRTIYAENEAIPSSDPYGISISNPAVSLAVLMSAAQFYEYREPIVTGTIVAELPMAYAHALGPYRILFPELMPDP
ncbi:MAG: phage gp6-like head-tail connector protein [Aeromonadaceae bacterium]|nr:phage gp6-like head-tail connector protein [Aeromonadaceae bacterium]MBP8220101.1 phage gp6-like head-tail connector protein [Aeromonadaceae bacterium]